MQNNKNTSGIHKNIKAVLIIVFIALGTYSYGQGEISVLGDSLSVSPFNASLKAANILYNFYPAANAEYQSLGDSVIITVTKTDGSQITARFVHRPDRENPEQSNFYPVDGLTSAPIIYLVPFKSNGDFDINVLTTRTDLYCKVGVRVFSATSEIHYQGPQYYIFNCAGN